MKLVSRRVAGLALVAIISFQSLPVIAAPNRGDRDDVGSRIVRVAKRVLALITFDDGLVNPRP
jgi:hypothetical protein